MGSDPIKTSSEKRSLDIPGQLNFFNEAEMEQDPAAAKAEELEACFPEKASKKRKARTTDAERFKGVPIEKKYLDLSVEEKLCPICGTPLKEIGEEFVRRELVFIPAKLKVYEYYNKSYLMCDVYSGYNKVPDARRTACWAHIRRYLTDAIPKGKALDYTQPSVQGMLYINQLFRMEDVIKSKYSSFDAIQKARLEKK